MIKNDLDKKYPYTKKQFDSSLKKLQWTELRLLKIFDDICRNNNIEYFLAFGTLLGAVRHKGFIPWDDDTDIAMTKENYKKLLKVKKEFPKSIFFQTSKNSNIVLENHLTAKLRDNNSNFEVGKDYNSGIFLDIFVLEKIRKNRFLSKIQKYILIFLRAQKNIQDNETLFNSISKYKRRFLKLLLIFPRCISKFLKLNYGLKKLYFSMFPDKESDLDYMYWNKFFIFKKHELYPLKRIKFEDSKFLVPKDPKIFLEAFYGDYMRLPPKNERMPKHVKDVEWKFNF